MLTDGEDPAPGTCSGCDSRFAGDAESAPAAVRAALEAWSLEGVDPDSLTAALFVLPPGSGAQRQIAVVSDEREGFYRWWLFAPLADDAAHAAIADVLAELEPPA